MLYIWIHELADFTKDDLQVAGSDGETNKIQNKVFTIITQQVVVLSWVLECCGNGPYFLDLDIWVAVNAAVAIEYGTPRMIAKGCDYLWFWGESCKHTHTYIGETLSH